MIGQDANKFAGGRVDEVDILVACARQKSQVGTECVWAISAAIGDPFGIFAVLVGVQDVCRGNASEAFAVRAESKVRIGTFDIDEIAFAILFERPEP